MLSAGVSAQTWNTVGDEVAVASTAYTTTGTAPALPPPPGPARLGFDVLVDGDDASTAPGPAVPVRDPVFLECVATNRGGRDLWALYDAPAGRYASPVQMGGSGNDGRRVVGEDPVHYFGGL